MKIIASFFVICFILFNFACGGTLPVKPESAEKVPADRLFAFQEITNKNTSTLIVVRDEGFVGSACFLGFSINGKYSARI